MDTQTPIKTILCFAGMQGKSEIQESYTAWAE